MTHLIAKWRNLVQSQSGAVAIEYALIAAAMLLAIYPAFYFITSALGLKLQVVVDAFTYFS
jgi:Flp pilus assembly pilin Flp